MDCANKRKRTSGTWTNAEVFNDKQLRRNKDWLHLILGMALYHILEMSFPNDRWSELDQQWCELLEKEREF